MAKTGTKKSLVIVESPAKAKTINRYLGSDYEVKASMGHVRDLPSKGINVDIDNNFAPTYEITASKRRVVASLRAAAKKCDKLFLATDLDREGEAIAWHLAQILGVPDKKVYRVIFNAITSSAIKQAFAQPGRLNLDKVKAQQTRRILDRIVGYQISPLLWKKVARGLSAGRVQSVAVELIVEREKEIRQFEPQEYWLIPAVFSTEADVSWRQEWREFIGDGQEGRKPPSLTQQNRWLAAHNAFKAELYKIGDEPFKACSKEEVERVFKCLDKAKFKVAELQTKESVSRPSPPFITSTLQQASANRLGFTAKRTMRVAQTLYEGIDLGSMGALGLITYMRTDSTHVSQEAVTEVRSYIGRHMGSEYLPEKAQIYASRKNAQQAHEAIRPTDVDFKASDIKEFLTDEQYKLYELIWCRYVACQMAAARWDVTNLSITAATAMGDCLYKTAGRVLVFDGYSKVWGTSQEQQQLPQFQVSQQLYVADIETQQHFTKPPARYNEASLVKTLEKEGIGRPSTYAAIISTIQDRNYVEKIDKKFFATDLGEIVTDKLVEYFPKIMDVAFTRFMEEQLDEIEEHHLDWIRVLQEFYVPFKDSLQKATEQMKHAKAETTPSDYKCPQCGRPLVYRFGRNGRFLSCSRYPNCKYACGCDREGKMLEEKRSEQKCPKCGKVMLEKNSRFGRFLGCSGYPDCKSILKMDKDGKVLPPAPPPEPTGIKCYKCDKGELVIRASKKGPFLGCNRFPKCRTIVSIKQLEHLKELQAAGKWPPQQREEAEELLGRKRKGKKVKEPTI